MAYWYIMAVIVFLAGLDLVWDDLVGWFRRK